MTNRFFLEVLPQRAPDLGFYPQTRRPMGQIHLSFLKSPLKKLFSTYLILVLDPLQKGSKTRHKKEIFTGRSKTTNLVSVRTALAAACERYDGAQHLAQSASHTHWNLGVLGACFGYAG